MEDLWIEEDLVLALLENWVYGLSEDRLWELLGEVPGDKFLFVHDRVAYVGGMSGVWARKLDGWLRAAPQTRADRSAELEALYERVSAGEPEPAMHALEKLINARDSNLEHLRSRLGRRPSPMDVFERGLGGLDPDILSRTVVNYAVDVAMPFVETAPEDLVALANLVWGLDYAASWDPFYPWPAPVERKQTLAPLRRLRPPPPPPDSADENWADVPDGALRVDPESDDKLEVKVSAFRILRHEVTNREVRRLVPDHQGADDLPAAVTWWQAYAYAAWLGGRLPTEAEWEYAAQAGCPFEYCTRNQGEASVDEVAWTLQNSPETPRPVMRLEPNGWGLFDMYGNLWEWTADWAGDSGKKPWALTRGAGRVARGGAYADPPSLAGAASRTGTPPANARNHGFRVVLPEGEHYLQW